MKTDITKAEIKSIADHCGFEEPSEEHYSYVLCNYIDYANNDPSGYWELWVEGLLYDSGLIKKK